MVGNLGLRHHVEAIDPHPLVREGGRLWFVDTTAGRDTAGATTPALPARTAVDAGDRITIRCGNASAEVLFAHCTSNGSRHD